MKKILLIDLLSKHILTFRKKLIEKLQRENYDITVIVFDDIYKKEIEAQGIKFYCLKDDNRGLNFFKILTLKHRYYKIIKDVKPDVVFTFMLKPNLFGVKAAKKAGVENIYAMVEGAGDTFIYNSIKWKVIRLVVCALFKRSFRFPKTVFFLNTDDKLEFVQRKLVTADKCEIINGIGVDTEKFNFTPVKNQRTFLMIARMLKTKGIFDYLEAAKIVKQKYPDAVFNYLGAEVTVKKSDIKGYIDKGIVNYLGVTKDVRPYIEDCTVTVLPSYREGLAVVNIEAGAMGRATITTATNGAKETVIDGKTGFLVPVKNPQSVAEKCIYIIEHPEEAVEMGIKAREFVKETFNADAIVEKIYSIIKV